MQECQIQQFRPYIKKSMGRQRWLNLRKFFTWAQISKQRCQIKALSTFFFDEWWNLFLGGLSPSEKLSEIKPPLVIIDCIFLFFFGCKIWKFSSLSNFQQNLLTFSLLLPSKATSRIYIPVPSTMHFRYSRSKKIKK